MANIGFSIGDIVAVGNLAWSLYKSCRSAGSEFQFIAQDVNILKDELRELSDEAKSPSSLIHRCTQRQQDEVQDIMKACSSDLRQLETTMQNYRSLNTSDARMRDRLRFTSAKQIEMKAKLSTHASRINLFLTHLNTGSLARVETTQELHTKAFDEIKTKLDAIYKDICAGRKDPSILLSHVEDWRALEKELVDDDITVVDVKSHKEDIEAWLKMLQEDDMVAESSQTAGKATQYQATVEDAEEEGDPPQPGPSEKVSLSHSDEGSGSDTESTVSTASTASYLSTLRISTKVERGHRNKDLESEEGPRPQYPLHINITNSDESTDSDSDPGSSPSNGTTYGLSVVRQQSSSYLSEDNSYKSVGEAARRYDEGGSRRLPGSQNQPLGGNADGQQGVVRAPTMRRAETLPVSPPQRPKGPNTGKTKRDRSDPKSRVDAVRGPVVTAINLGDGFIESSDASFIEKDLPIELKDLVTGATRLIHVVERYYDHRNRKTSTHTRFLSIELPNWKGYKHGDEIRYKDMGCHRKDGTRQSVHFRIVENPHPIFKRERGGDLRQTVHITLKELLCGIDRMIPTIDGKPFHLSVSGPMMPTDERTVMNLGMPTPANTSQRGAMILDFVVEYPRYLSAAQKEAIGAALKESKRPESAYRPSIPRGATFAY